MNDVAWYLARAAGITSWLLVTASVLCGLLLPLRLTRRPSPQRMLEVHRFLGGTAAAFVGIHVLSLLLDPVARLDLGAVLVPFASWWQPVAVAFGVVALWLLLAVEATSLLRRHLPRRGWRAVHLASYVVFGASTVHALAAGSDAGLTLFAWTVRLVTVVVVALTALRVDQVRRRRTAPPTGPSGGPSDSDALRPRWQLPTSPPLALPGDLVPERPSTPPPFSPGSP
jgi:DMSO/TMAO reductase YedYZ heme-binding membrane subunit